MATLLQHLVLDDVRSVAVVLVVREFAQRQRTTSVNVEPLAGDTNINTLWMGFNRQPRGISEQCLREIDILL